MSAQNFDPEWAKHLKHDPDRPLAPDEPVPKNTWEQLFAVYEGGLEKGPRPVGHNVAIRPKGAMEPSKAWISVQLTILETKEQLTLPCETSTTIAELAANLAAKLAISPDELRFVQKNGLIHRQMYPHEQVARRMTVKGTQSFTRQRQKYADPHVIIGAGHIGLRMAMFLVERGVKEFVVFDRMFRVGGTSWMYQANSTSKLQTEYGSYHLNYGENYSMPTEFSTAWPSRNALLDHFQRQAEAHGIMPYIRLNTNVKSMNVVSHDKSYSGPNSLKNIRYDLEVEKITAERLKYGKLIASESPAEESSESFSCSSICMFPGNLTLPRLETYKGEDQFEGDIGYAMFNEINYHALEGEDVTIVGHGAFAVENIRTCCEFGVRQIYMVCRRKNLSCPRVCSWMANRSLNPLSNARFMKSMEPMYNLIDYDPWSYHSVQANEKRTQCQIVQKARFGIGDIYFLSIYMGKCELIVDPLGVKRLTKHEVHLASGRRLHCKGLLKLLGLVGEFDNDRLLGIKEMVGFWVNGDPRRYIVSEPVSVMCSQMGGTSLSPGAYSWTLEGLYFVDYPKDFDSGPLASGMLPRHKADLSDENTPRPAYVVDARHGTTTGMTVGMFTPGLAEFEQSAGFIKAVRHRLCHPIRKFLAQAKEDWDFYANKMLQEGFGTKKEYPHYPYTAPVVKELYQAHMMESQEPWLPGDQEDWALCDA